MSATPAKVSSGRMSEITPAIPNSTAKIHRITRLAPPVTAPSASCWAAETRNMTPIRTPTVVTDAWSN